LGKGAWVCDPWPPSPSNSSKAWQAGLGSGFEVWAALSGLILFLPAPPPGEGREGGIGEGVKLS